MKAPGNDCLNYQIRQKKQSVQFFTDFFQIFVMNAVLKSFFF